jgi:hypothetical protein
MTIGLSPSCLESRAIACLDVRLETLVDSNSEHGMPSSDNIVLFGFTASFLAVLGTGDGVPADRLRLHDVSGCDPGLYSHKDEACGKPWMAVTLATRVDALFASGTVWERLSVGAEECSALSPGNAIGPEGGSVVAGRRARRRQALWCRLSVPRPGDRPPHNVSC